MENYIKGLEYEKQVQLYLLKSNSKVYLWNSIPLDIFIQSKIFECYRDKLNYKRDGINHGITDTGCDIFYFNKTENQWIIVQCKNYTGTVTLEKLAGFYDMIVSTGSIRGVILYV